MRAPMARAVIGGLITSTLLSLLVVPVVYTFLDDFRPSAVLGWISRRKPAARHDQVPVTSPASTLHETVR
jgi:HAE1 family hydrophobic/amphiphilic exporter-1